MWPFRPRHAPPGEDLDAAHADADRAIVDAQNLRSRTDDVVDRIHRQADGLAETQHRNHIAEAVTNILRRRS